MGYRTALPGPGVRVTDPKAAQCGEVLKGRAETGPVQAVRKGVHSGAPDRRADGFFRRLVRRLLQLRVSQKRALTKSFSQFEPSPRKGRAAKLRFRDSQIEMAHGAGGKASRRLIEGLFVPLLFAGCTEPLGDAAHLNINGTRMAITTDGFVVKPLSFPAGPSANWPSTEQ